jgi:hypothetical protein
MADRPADRHQHQRRYFRPEPSLYERAAAILRARGSNVNDYLVQCLVLLVRQADSGNVVSAYVIDEGSPRKPEAPIGEA